MDEGSTATPSTRTPEPSAQAVALTVVICTVDRFALADQAIASVLEQEATVGRPFELVIVDNSPSGMSRDRIEALATTSTVPVRYVHEPRQNIARARNAGMAAARGALIACLDDDQVAPPTWLRDMVAALETHEADALLGATYPIFEGGVAPDWDPDGRYHCRKRDMPTGSPMRQGGAGNLLLRRDSCLTDPEPFDPQFGRTGGEDSDFLKRLRTRGLRVLWCAEPAVGEYQPRNRMTLQYRSQRTFVTAQTNVRVRLKNSRHKRLTGLRSAGTGVLQVVVLALPYLVSSRLRSPLLLHARFKFLTGLGKLLWWRTTAFY